MSKQNILVIAAHPDDEILGAGGAIARHIEEEDNVRVLILGEDISSRAGVPRERIEREQKKLYACSQKALKFLGAGAPVQKSLPDNAFDSVPLLSVVHGIEAVMKEMQPHIVYTHHGSDVNVDHRITSDAVLTAVRPAKDGSVMEVRAFEVPSSTEWNFTRPLFRPQVFVGLTEAQLKKKIAAMRAYRSEIRSFPHPRSAEYLEALARVRGGQAGFPAAEAFELVYRRV
ncbi:GlcNAc-PI de-N-acetylase [Candidatus Kaiserbacteria bacterium CG10_big_fil_rev_8_21_14_0_10_59_10]|uniref:GlcNAc-PI de-N-acetylase n=1 Tax=Candidatus Kaiserbacteria bacterium CG10_big_fil_rev_8_21_14_0_10_59_10 TaxID=1974612 RepID=A0A2H0U9J7_9BACT|nr:MAG: GlcNAc-PI de-N-acetylase [Candidatus Kaiserbacteria bacterium CG10_big_fil_rev_8_21_14_0_10_59_10]